MPEPADRASIEWNALEYDRLDRPQQAWARSILATVVLHGDETVLDAGCGTAKVAATIAQRIPRGRVVAVDRSANMLAVARRTFEARGTGRALLVRADLQALPFDRAIDLVVSTAAFHWVRDHDRLFRELFAVLRPGGRLVAQCGGGPNIARVLGRAERLLASPAHRRYFEGWSGPWYFADPGPTAARLRDVGFVEIETELVEAPTVLSDREEYRAFLEAVVLRAHCARLPDTALRDEFLDRLADVGAADDPPFSLDYWRLNIRARRPTAPADE